MIVRVEEEASTRDEAYGRAAEVAAAVDQLVGDVSPALGRVLATAVAVIPRRQQKKGDSVQTGWIASRTSTIEVKDLTRVASLIHELTTAGASVTGLTWKLEPDNAAYSEARRLAAADARRKAEDYASALDLKLGQVLWIAEPGLRDSRAEQLSVRAAAYAGSAVNGDGQVIAVEPEEISISAVVDVATEFRD